ncbi:MAG: ketopantoate reductase family protein [Halobacteriales archaeon]
MEVVVVGAGSLGSLLGGLLAREHAVTLVGRDPHVSAVRREGLRVTGAREFAVSPAARTDLGDATADIALVTVKAFDTEGAAATLADADVGAVCSLQNGLGNEERLAAHLDPPILAGVTTFGARLEGPGVVECTGVGDVTVGPHADAPLEAAERAGAAFRAAGTEATVVGDPRPALWEKLAVNAGINPVTALARIENGALADGPAAELAERAAREVAAVARAEGIDLDGADAVGALRAVVERTAANTSSMRQDVEAGRPTEIDALNGAVAERAPEGVDTPVNATLAALVRAREA